MGCIFYLFAVFEDRRVLYGKYSSKEDAKTFRNRMDKWFTNGFTGERNEGFKSWQIAAQEM